MVRKTDFAIGDTSLEAVMMSSLYCVDHETLAIKRGFEKGGSVITRGYCNYETISALPW